MSRRRTLRPDEQEIWQAVAKTARPMHPGTPLPINAAPNAPPKVPTPKTPPPKLAPFRVAQSVAMASTVQLSPSISDHLAAAPLRMDAKTHAKMTRGKLMPEARIDLHGLTLDQAHPALIDFVTRCHSAGMRLILVITGNGKSRPDHGPIPQKVGALRHQVPQWLARPPLAARVLQVSESHLRHGGGGALYVYMRRQ